jgi:hypothetical protein
LPWFVYENNEKDMTGQNLNDVYPKTSVKSDFDSYTTELRYDGVSVTEVLEEPYTIYSIVYGKEGSTLNADVIKTENMKYNSISVGNSNPLGIESLADVLEGIANEQLCISKSANSLYTRVFVNDNAIIE